MKLPDKYKIKIEELSLTGNIPKHPHYLYEYKLPEDFQEIEKLIDLAEEFKQIPYVIYLNKDNEPVIACNTTPVCIQYKPEGIE